MDQLADLNLTVLLSKALGYGIIAASLMLKVPQISKILQAKSVEGLSFSMFILELIGYTITFAYNFNSGYPVSTYGENFFIAVQNVVIIYLLFSYTGQLTMFYTLTAVYGGIIYALFGGLVPLETQRLLQLSTIPIFALSKIPQIWMNFQQKSTGQLSVITVAMMFAGSATRVFTTLTEVSDNTILLGFVIGAFLNGVLLLQCLVFGPGKTAAGKKD